MIRRLIDIAAALIGLVALSPLLGAVALAVRLDSAGPALYGGWRAGLEGRPFRMWKFRTMVLNADRVGPGITGKGDARITRIGSWLRRTKIDELPQLLNLLKGDVTLIGPRAEVPSIVARFTPSQRAILSAKPGITGPGQLYFTTDQQDTIPEGVSPDDFYVEHLLGPKLALDLDYIRNPSLARDLGLILETVKVVAKALVAR